jgi:hypothetical protein
MAEAKKAKAGDLLLALLILSSYFFYGNRRGKPPTDYIIIKRDLKYKLRQKKPRNAKSYKTKAGHICSHCSISVT